jgi:hypothetical protein
MSSRHFQSKPDEQVETFELKIEQSLLN